MSITVRTLVALDAMLALGLALDAWIAGACLVALAR